MAGQPEPSFQPSGQDQGLTQGRPAWQAASYPPPGAASPGGQQGYSAPSYGAQDQAYPPPDQSYTGHEQTYTSLGQGQGQDYQNYQGYQPPSYGAQPGQGASVPPPGWQAAPGVAPAAAPKKQPGEKGFIGSLFDFSFNSMVTPKIIKVLYVLFTLWTALVGLIILVIGFRTGHVAGGLFTLIIIEPIFLLLTLGIYRVVLEAFMVIFRIYDEMKQIRENTQKES
ncbi:MAG: DUF4282 domain-containing protein [Trebonia sp.]